ncbi:MAG: PDZ domain-containing protein [Candidatus Acidiferrum sp.]
MNVKFSVTVVGIAALGLLLAARPSSSSTLEPQDPQVQPDGGRAKLDAPEAGELEFSLGEGSWLGVETGEVTTDKARELKLPAEHGVLLGKVMEDSPAFKAGLKENDVVTEINGQRVEGTSQFRRMIREIPAGRSVQLTVWRAGRTQQITATLGKADGERSNWFRAAPGAFAFQIPEMPDMPEIAPMPDIQFDGGLLALNPRPRLGIDAEDLSGQLGSFFGAPEGEGILVREVSSGSLAEKAGLKAGDVIVSFNGERLRSVGDLRAKLSTGGSDKTSSVKLGVIRNRSEISLNVDLPPAAPKRRKTVVHQTNI